MTHPAAIRQWFTGFADSPTRRRSCSESLLSLDCWFPCDGADRGDGGDFGPWLGFAYAAAGALASAIVAYGVGALAGRQTLEDLMGPRLNRVRRSITRRGVLAIAAVRMVPIAPFTLVNLAAGASNLILVDYVLGTRLAFARTRR